GQHEHHGVDRLFPTTEDAQEGHAREDRREHRQHPEEEERGGEVGTAVAEELDDGPHRHESGPTETTTDGPQCGVAVMFCGGRVGARRAGAVAHVHLPPSDPRATRRGVYGLIVPRPGQIPPRPPRRVRDWSRPCRRRAGRRCHGGRPRTAGSGASAGNGGPSTPPRPPRSRAAPRPWSTRAGTPPTPAG